MSVLHAIHKAVKAATLWYRYDWCLRPRLFLAPVVVTLVTIITVINFLSTTYTISTTSAQHISRSRAADQIEGIPDEWAANIRRRAAAGEITPFQAEAQLQMVAGMRAESLVLADKIRSLSQEQWQEMLKGQAVQMLTTKVAGYGGKLLAQNLPHLRLVAGMPKEEMIAKIKEVLVLAKFAGNTNDAVYNAVGSGRSIWGPGATVWDTLDERQRQLVVLIDQLTGQSASDLLAAKFNHYVRYFARNQMTRDEIRDFVVGTVDMPGGRLELFYPLTQEGGSADSIWKNVDDLVAWLYGQAEAQAQCDDQWLQPYESELLQRLRAEGRNCSVSAITARLACLKEQVWQHGRCKDEAIEVCEAIEIPRHDTGGTVWVVKPTTAGPLQFRYNSPGGEVWGQSEQVTDLVTAGCRTQESVVYTGTYDPDTCTMSGDVSYSFFVLPGTSDGGGVREREHCFRTGNIDERFDKGGDLVGHVVPWTGTLQDGTLTVSFGSPEGTVSGGFFADVRAAP